MQTAIIIPARYASTRLPGKPLLRETGKYLIQHVYERALEAGAAEVLVATDDERIVRAVASFGGRAVRTRADHASGTDRVAEVARQLQADLIVNLQGDEPLIDPATIGLLPSLLERDPEAEVATVATPIRSAAQYFDPNCVKVVRDEWGRALYFSRSPIPYVRDRNPEFDSTPSRFLQHIGLYAYRRSFLVNLALLPPSPLEQLEKLEQLRILGAGRGIQVGIVDHACWGVDTPEDYQRFVHRHREQSAARAA